MQEEVKQEVAVEENKEQELDLVTRVSKFKVEPEKKEEDKGVPPLDQAIPTFTKVEDAVEWAKNKEKEWASGYGKKFQELAGQRKELERQLTETNLWTPEKIQRLLNDQNFVTAAQEVMQSQNPSNSGKSDEEWSSLSEGEKQKFYELQNEINLLKQQNQRTTEEQQDELLKSKYASYDSNLVKKLRDDLIHNRVKATNEHLWKVVDYESAIDRAYKLGRQEERDLKKEKANAFPYSPDSVNVSQEQKLSDDAKVSLTQLYEHNKKVNENSELRK